MAEDHEVLRQVWNGRVPVSFALAGNEVESVEQPDQLFMLLSRITYFPLVIDRVQRYFQRYAASDKSSASAASALGDIWFEDDSGSPVRWHFPVGVLYDLAVQSTSTPWQLTVHFNHFPEHELIRLSCRDAVEAIFMSAVKEADCLKHRGQVINGMQKRDHKQLWNGIVNEKFDTFWPVNHKLMELSTGENGFRSIPYRIHRPDLPLIQMPFPPFSDSGNALVLRDLLRSVMPDITESGDNGPSLRQHRVIIHGVEASLDAPVQWLSEHLSHPDNFLHVCLLSRS